MGLSTIINFIKLAILLFFSIIHNHSTLTRKLTRKGTIMAKNDRIKRVIGGVKSFLGKGKRSIEKDEIESILPHRGRMLLLDKVIISDEKVVGHFLITEEVCKGHEFNGQLIFRGVDIIEMSNQLLGIWLAQHSESEEKMAFFRRVFGEVKFFGVVVPSDILTIEIPVAEGNPRIEISGRPDRPIERAIAENIVAKVKGDNKAVISGIELSIVNKQSLVE